MAQDKFTKSAKGQDCQVRLDFVCNVTPETVIFAHLPEGGLSGMGIKARNIFGAYCCHACHAVIDGQVPLPINFKDRNEVLVYAYQGAFRTQELMISSGLIKL